MLKGHIFAEMLANAIWELIHFIIIMVKFSSQTLWGSLDHQIMQVCLKCLVEKIRPGQEECKGSASHSPYPTRFLGPGQGLWEKSIRILTS